MRTKAISDEALPRIVSVLRKVFPNDTVDVSLSGIRDNIHVVVVSRKLDKYKTSKTKQEYLWGLIDSSDLTEEEKKRITLIMPLSPAELK